MSGVLEFALGLGVPCAQGEVRASGLGLLVPPPHVLDTGQRRPPPNVLLSVTVMILSLPQRKGMGGDLWRCSFRD